MNSSTVSAGSNATAAQYNNLRLDFLQNGGQYVALTGGTTAYIATVDDQLSASEMVAGFRLCAKVNVTNTDAATLQINDSGGTLLSAKSIKFRANIFDSSNLVGSKGGDLLAGQTYIFEYDGTQFQAIGENLFPEEISREYTYGETIAQYDSLYIDDSDSYKLKKITSTTQRKFFGIAMQSGVNNDAGKPVLRRGLVTYSSSQFADVNPTFSQGTGGNDYQLNTAGQDYKAYGHKFTNSGAEAVCSGGTIRVKKNGTPVTLRIRLVVQSNSDVPNAYDPGIETNGTLGEATIAAGSVSTSYSDVAFAFASPIKIPAGCIFWLVVAPDTTTTDSTNYYTIETNSATRPVYYNTGGVEYAWTNNGSLSTIRCALTMTSTPQTGYGVRCFDGTTAGTITTGGGNIWGRVIGRVLSTTTYYLDAKSEYQPAVGTISHTMSTGAGNARSIVNTLGFRPSRLELDGYSVISATTNEYYGVTGYFDFVSIASGNLYADGFTVRMGSVSNSAAVSTRDTSDHRLYAIPLESGFILTQNLENSLSVDGVSLNISGFSQINLQLRYKACQN